MLSAVRLRLTILYAGVSLLFIGVLGTSCYVLLDRYLEGTTDLALQHKMAHEFIERKLPVPQALADADRYWMTSRTSFLPQPMPETSITTSDERLDKTTVASEEAFEGDLAAIFVIPLTPDGTSTITATGSAFPITPDRAAIAAAIQHERDWRTIVAPNGTRVRLLTYRLHDNDQTAALQAGRTLNDQDRLLLRLLEGLLVLGGASAILIGWGGWWLAGRSLQPAQQAWARQQAFVANASHELRTPLTLLRASTEVVRRELPVSAASSRTWLDDMLHECDYMARLLEDLLLLSRLDAKGLQFELQDVPLRDLFDGLERQMGRLALERGIQFTASTVPVTVHSDATRLRQVVLILIDNALRYTPSGGTIRLTAERQARHVLICVGDTGCGIAPEHVPQLFERFYRADPAHARSTGGSGLGLAIAKALVVGQHGRIWIESSVNSGTRVYVTLPCGL